MLLAVPDLPGSAVVLDCMSGAGELGRVIANRVAALHLTDLSIDMLELVDPGAGATVRTCADARFLPYRSESFDAVFVRGGLHHVYQNHSSVLSEIYRVLRPGGWFVCSEPCDDNWLVRTTRRVMYHLSDQFEPEDERGFSHREIVDAFTQARFRNIKLSPFGYSGYALMGNTDVLPIFRRIRSRVIIDALIRFDEISPRIWLWRQLALCCIIRGQK